MSLPTSGDSNPPNNPILQYYQDWSSRTPFVTRSSMIGMAYFTVMHLELYRLILSPLSFITFLELFWILDSTIWSNCHRMLA
eukprot:gene55494-74089_t